MRFDLLVAHLKEEVERVKVKLPAGNIRLYFGNINVIFKVERYSFCLKNVIKSMHYNTTIVIIHFTVQLLIIQYKSTVNFVFI